MLFRFWRPLGSLLLCSAVGVILLQSLSVKLLRFSLVSTNIFSDSNTSFIIRDVNRSSNISHYLVDRHVTDKNAVVSIGNYATEYGLCNSSSLEESIFCTLRLCSIFDGTEIIARSLFSPNQSTVPILCVYGQRLLRPLNVFANLEQAANARSDDTFVMYASSIFSSIYFCYICFFSFRV